MKLIKIFTLSASLILAFGVISVSLYQEHCRNQQDYSSNLSVGMDIQAKEKEADFLEATLSAQAATKEVDYYLPYPGILPDHPLYWLKMIRDKIKLSFTKDAKKRFVLLLLYADKRIGAAEALIKGNKLQLGATTATKAEKYLLQAGEQLQLLAKDNQATAMEREQIKKAIAKHQEIIKLFLDKNPDNKQGLEQALQINLEIQKQMNNL